MLIVSLEKIETDEYISIDPYIPIDVTWGSIDRIEEIPRYCRYGDLKKSMLEIGVGSVTGRIHSITLIAAKEIYLNSMKHSLQLNNCRRGLPNLNAAGWSGTEMLDVKRRLVVSTCNNELTLSIGDIPTVNCIQSGRVKFALDEESELCGIVIVELSDEEMVALNASLENMI